MRRRTALGILAGVALLAGCGSAERPGDRIHGRILTIYFSAPLHGASRLTAAAALNGARLALDEVHSRIGTYRIRFRTLDDSTAPSRGWDPNQATLDARSAAQDPTTIGYLGDFNSGATAISIPILNRVGIPQISPGSTAVGLTSPGPGAAPGEPQKYYPSGVRTFVRVVPSDAHQALALVHAEAAFGCHTTFVLEDGEVDGEDAALTFLLTAQSARLRVVGVQAFQVVPSDYTGLAQSIASSGADCVVISAIAESSAVRLTVQVARALPRVTIFASDPLADGAYVDPRLGGLPSAFDDRVILVSSILPAHTYPPAGRRFLTEYARRFGPAEPSAIFGYQAMALLLQAILRATDDGHHSAERSKVRAELFSGRRIHGVLGDFTIDRFGDISLRRYGVYRIVNGALGFLEQSG